MKFMILLHEFQRICTIQYLNHTSDPTFSLISGESALNLLKFSSFGFYSGVRGQ